MKEQDGCFNKSADKVKRVDKTWSDTNLNEHFNKKDTFKRLKCRNCGGISFEVLITGDYETSARCDNCGMYYKVHCG
jgi:ribosomal protein S27E